MHAAFLRAILEKPDDDTPRLVYCDWLNEQGGKDDSDRAEFIRVQCEIAATSCSCGHDAPNGLCRRCCVLRRRERELLNTHGYGWAGPCAPFVGPPKDWPDRFRRGFVEAVTLSCAAFVGGSCPRCLTPDGQTGYLHRDCPDCSGTGRTPGHAGSLFSVAPITRVTLSDKRPWESEDLFLWQCYDGDYYEQRNAGYALPRALFDLLPPADQMASSNRSVWSSATLAADALSAALVAHGRSLAGLPAPAGR